MATNSTAASGVTSCSVYSIKVGDVIGRDFAEALNLEDQPRSVFEGKVGFLLMTRCSMDQYHTIFRTAKS